MSIVLNSSGGGSVTINEPSTASNFTVTLPAATGTAMVSGNQPAFSVYMSTNQTVASSNVKLAFNTVVFDTNSNYNTTNYRFTPTVAGYYQFNATMNGNTDFTIPCVQIWKNGQAGSSSNIQGYQQYTGGRAYNADAGGIFYMNGSTDYVEVYLYSSSGGTVGSGSNGSVFTGCLLRTA
jgi:hypothetical protein